MAGERLAPRPEGLPDSVPCAFCDGRETELFSMFGTALSVVTYWCRDCRTPFEWVKWDEHHDAPPSTTGA